MPDYATGPGARGSSHGPVIEAYVDTDALEILCENCGVAAGDFCKHPDGTPRRAPCPRRIAGAARARRDQ